MTWFVALTNKAEKQADKLPTIVRITLQTLMDEIAISGPVRGDWPNYSKLDGDRHHCHLKKGKPTYVAVWTAKKKTVTVEIVMLARTKKPLIERKTVPLCFMVHPDNIEKIKAFVAEIEPETVDSSAVSADDFFDKNFHGQSRLAIHLKGLRYREGLTQAQLSEKAGIPQRHISEMENGKRPIGKAAAHKLADALGTDYRLFL